MVLTNSNIFKMPDGVLRTTVFKDQQPMLEEEYLKSQSNVNSFNKFNFATSISIDYSTY